MLPCRRWTPSPPETQTGRCQNLAEAGEVEEEESLDGGDVCVLIEHLGRWRLEEVVARVDDEQRTGWAATQGR